MLKDKTEKMTPTNNHRFSSLIFLFVFLACSCSQNNFKAEVIVKKSPNDDREYQYLVLDNQLKVLLVSDLEAEKSAAAFAVFRGSLSDPDSRPGLAHFFEHMLFIGTEKYPEVDSFQNFINANGGGSNAYTASDHTNYFFDIKTSAFREGLDRFAHFFISPLLSEEYVDREKNAVHSEYQMQKKEDGWRQFMVSKLAMNSKYGGSRFSIGSLETLSGDVREELVEFQNDQYSADQMGAVVLSNESIESMRLWVEPLFNLIPNREIGEGGLEQEMLRAEELPITITSKPIKDKYRVEYTFPVPNISETYEIKPDQYITNLLGHEGSGSLHKLLNSFGWIESLSAGSGVSDKNNSSINVGLSLTQKGSEHIPDITSLLFQYIDILKENPPEQWLYQEQSVVANLAFEFQEKSAALQYVYGIAPRLQHYPPKDLISSSYLMKEFEPQLISSFIDHLRKDNVLIEIINPEAPVDQVEKWFEVPYKIEKNHIDMSPVDTDQLFLPPKNPFLPENLSLLDADKQSIVQTNSNDNIRIWMDRDLEFGTPKSNVYLRLNLPGGLITAQDRVNSQVYRSIVSDELTESIYPAYLAGLSGQHRVTDSGYEVQIAGFSDKQLTLLETIMSKVTNATLDPERFEVIKSNLIRKWLNSSKDYPYRQALNSISEILISNRWPAADLARIAESLTLKQLENWRAEKFKKVSVDGLLHGNVSTQTRQAFEDLLIKQLSIGSVDPVKSEIKELDQSVLLELNIDHDDASMVIYIQDTDDNISTRATSSLAGQMIGTPYFSDLRTDQQLGYVVNAGARLMNERNGLVFLVQSPVQGADYLEEATASFLAQYLESLDTMTEQEFRQHQDGLINNLLQRDKNLSQRSQRYWSDLKKDNLAFDTREQLAEAIKALTKPNIVAYLSRVQSDLEKKRLLVFSQGKFNSRPTSGIKISDSKFFK